VCVCVYVCVRGVSGLFVCFHVCLFVGWLVGWFVNVGLFVSASLCVSRVCQAWLFVGV
jgi:hypothetical protein